MPVSRIRPGKCARVRLSCPDPVMRSRYAGRLALRLIGTNPSIGSTPIDRRPKRAPVTRPSTSSSMPFTQEESLDANKSIVFASASASPQRSMGIIAEARSTTFALS